LLIDSHAHLFLEEFDSDREQVIDSAHKAGVGIIVNAGIDLKSSKEALRLASSYPGLLATAGLHPQVAASADSEDIKQIDLLARERNVVAIGEIGLDYYRGSEHRDAQLFVFNEMLEVAKANKLPVVLHCRSAEEDMLRVLEKWCGACPPVRGKWRGIRHCFGEDEETARRYIEMGFMLSFGAYAGYPSSKNLRPVLESLPLDCLLLETDSPYLPPQKLRGKRNEPSYITSTAELIAMIRGESAETIASTTTENARLIFGLNPNTRTSIAQLMGRAC